MTVSPVNGKLYISDYMKHRVIQIATMGPVQNLEQNYKVIAGNGEECSTGLVDECGDGGLAIQARLLGPKGQIHRRLRLLYLTRQRLTVHTSSGGNLLKMLIPHWMINQCYTKILIISKF